MSRRSCSGAASASRRARSTVGASAGNTVRGGPEADPGPVAQAYLEYLYTPEGQEIAAKNFYRPRDTGVAAKYASEFPKVRLVTVDEVFGGWKKAHATHFADGALFDQIYQPGR